MGGLDFARVEHIEERHPSGRASAEAAERSVRVGDEILPCVDLRAWFDVKGAPPRGPRLVVRDASGRAFLVDRAFEVTVLPSESVLPLPPYLFGSQARPFRGVFPYRERWGLLLNPEGIFPTEKEAHAALA